MSANVRLHSRQAFLPFLLVLVLVTYAQPQTCPPCYYNQQPMSGGCCDTCPDGTGRRVIKIRIDGTWNDAGGGTNANIWNGIVGCPTCNPPLIGAIQRWNDQRDGSTTNPNDPRGWPTNYCFKIDQSAQNPDITITKGTPGGGGCAGFATNGWNPGSGGPYIIALPDGNQNFSQDTIASRIAHEIGHTIGLGNCDTSTSIMNSASSTNCSTNTTTQVQPNDVAMSNQNADPNRRPSCTVDATSGNQDSGGGGGGDDGGGGFSCDSISWNTCQDPNLSEYPSGGCPWYAPSDWNTGCCCGSSPILVDVEGNGFDLTDAPDGVTFDLNSDGSGEQLSWTTPQTDDSWLALDRNHNGIIDNGRELFGNFSPQPKAWSRNGFRALAEFDHPANGGNNDGKIDLQDSVYVSLLLWRDSNHNGVSETEELRTLAEAGLASIDLRYKEAQRRDQYGNGFRFRGKVKDLDGAQLGRWAWDVFLVVPSQR